MLLTMAAVAAAKEMPPAGFSVDVRMISHHDGGRGARFESTVRLGAGFSERERRILYNSARSCEVHHLLAGPIDFAHVLIVA